MPMPICAPTAPDRPRFLRRRLQTHGLDLFDDDPAFQTGFSVSMPPAPDMILAAAARLLKYQPDPQHFATPQRFTAFLFLLLFKALPANVQRHGRAVADAEAQQHSSREQRASYPRPGCPTDCYACWLLSIGKPYWQQPDGMGAHEAQHLGQQHAAMCAFANPPLHQGKAHNHELCMRLRKDRHQQLVQLVQLALTACFDSKLHSQYCMDWRAVFCIRTVIMSPW